LIDHSASRGVRTPPDGVHTVSTCSRDRDRRINRRHKEIAMYFRPARTAFGLIAVGGAIAVGVTTHDAGFTALTFIGGLLLPRILGFRGRGAHGWGAGGGHHDRMRGRFESCHRQAQAGAPAEQPPATTAAGA
jgi:hypothetical protein